MTRPRTGRRLLSLVAALLLAVACRRALSPLPKSPSLDEVVARGAFSVIDHGSPDGLSFDRPPRREEVALGDESRAAVIAGSRFWLRTRVPHGAGFHLGVGALNTPPESVRTVEVAVLEGSRRTLVGHATAPGGEDPQWLDLSVDLERFAGRTVTLAIETTPAGEVAWAPGTLTVSRGGGPSSPAPQTPSAGPPNILLIVVDTLRADHLGCYGHERRTTPNIDRWLAARGVRAEHAWAPAPWTLPSTVALLSGRDPGQLLGDDPASFGLPADAPSLAEELARLGYDTAAFIANPSLRRANGFARGFATFSTIGDGSAAMELHADSVNRRAVPWLAAHRDRRFFLYVHYIDPHDPYESPQLVRRRLAPDHAWYRGSLTGRDVHGLFAGRRELTDPARDIAHLAALYDSEVRTVDRAIGELLSTLPASIVANTLVVLTADHGEELFDHGGWKHGRTLFEEQLAVPLIWRWDGHLPAGATLPGTSSLLDVFPTLLRAAGGQPPLGDGVDLGAALAGEADLSPRPLVAAHRHSGPTRLAVLQHNLKLMLFDRDAPSSPSGPLERHFLLDEAARLPRLALFDLAQDPGERRDLASLRPRRVELLWLAAHGQLERELPGLRIVARGLPEGSRLRAELQIEPSPEGLAGYFLANGDQARLSGDELRLELIGEPQAMHKGVRVLGPVERVSVRRVFLEGTGAAARVTFLGPGEPRAGSPADLRRTSWPPPGDGAELLIWLPKVAPRMDRLPSTNREVEATLRALGYLQ